MRTVWFAVAGGVVLVTILAVGAVGLVVSDGESEVWSPPEPSVYHYETPSADGVATVGGESFDRLQAAVEAADPGDEVVLTGTFTERVTIDTPDIKVRTADDAERSAKIEGGGIDTVITIDAPDVTVSDVWISDSGLDRSQSDAGMLVNGSRATIERVQITDSLFGVWIDGASDVTIHNSTIVGDPTIPLQERGNGIHLWEADGAVLEGNDITQARDGIYFQWSSSVHAEGNRLWSLRYGVHYMYSDDNVLLDNLAFDNDVGFALMVSENLTVAENIAIDNRGPSSHGILVKDIDDSVLRGNEVVNNGQGLFVYNAHGNLFEENLILANDIGVQFTAGSSGEEVVGNSFINNELDLLSTVVVEQRAWNDTIRGNYWSDASVVDLDGDGTGEIRHQPAGIVEQLVYERPETAVFAESPAFDAVRLAESSFPIIETPGIVDHRPLTEPIHDHWRTYYER